MKRVNKLLDKKVLNIQNTLYIQKFEAKTSNYFFNCNFNRTI